MMHTFFAIQNDEGYVIGVGSTPDTAWEDAANQLGPGGTLEGFVCTPCDRATARACLIARLSICEGV